MHRLDRDDEALAARARAFVDELIPHEEHAELHAGELPDGMAATLAARARELGLTATNIPRSHGGQGCTMLQQVLVQEQAGRATNALGWILTTPPAWFCAVATAEQTERYLLPTVRGDATECYAITEEGAGSDVDAITATARREGEDYVLDGVKWHVTSFNHATYAFFQARLPAGEHAMFLVDLPSPGVRVVRTPAYGHTFAHHHPIVAFEDVRVPAGRLVGSEGGGMTYAREWFRFERTMVAARCVGAAERLVGEATAFAGERVAFGKAIAGHQLVQAMLADSATELFAARCMLYAAARAVDDGAPLSTQHAQASMVKLYASEMAGRVADRAVQIFGGRGYMRENVAERFSRELRVERIWEGTSEIQRLIVADQLAKRGVRSLT